MTLTFAQILLSHERKVPETQNKRIDMYLQKIDLYAKKKLF